MTLEALLEFLKRSRGFDFTGYKRASLERRIRKRMEAVGVDELRRLPRLPRGRTPTSSPQLFNTILINVTAFFRDPRGVGVPARARSCPRCSRRKRADEPIRVWSAGCASGEEAYTLAMVLAEALGERRVPRAREDLRDRRRRGRARRRRARGVYARKRARGRPAGAASSATSSAPTSATRSARTCAAR